MTVAAWSPLGGGLLSGKYSRPGAEGRLAAGTISERDHAVATAVQNVADELGATPAQIALAWIRRQSPAIHPIVGARTIEQLHDNLGAVNVVLPDEAARRLADATDFSLGFPADFIAQVSPWVFGEAAARVDAGASRR